MGKVRWDALCLDPVVVGCFAALLGVPIVAAIVARGLPLASGRDAAAPSVEQHGRPLRVVPAFSDGSQLERRMQRTHALTNRARMGVLLTGGLRDLFGRRRTRAIMRYVITPPVSRPDVVGADPARDPRVDSLLRAGGERRSRQANDVAALLILAAAADFDDAFRGGPVVAYAILRRARRTGGCVAQLNLAFLLAADEMSDDRAVRNEFADAERGCSGDPTPTWMLGQHASLLKNFGTAVAAFRRLQRSAPGSALGWSGEGDVELRRAYSSTVLGLERRPFTARAHFRRALRLYRRAGQVDPSPMVSAGVARALAGLGEYRAAVAEQVRALAGRRRLVPLAPRYVEYLERDRRFTQAARSARALSAAPQYVQRRSLYAQPGGPDLLDDVEDRGDPLSVGVDSMHPVDVDLQDSGGPLFTDGVIDVSFIPQFRSSGATGYGGWSPSWSVPRDLMLSGDPRAALSALRTCLTDIEVGELESACGQRQGLLAALAELEAGREARALARMPAPDALEGEPEVYASRPTVRGRKIAALRDAQQNMWRFAGHLGRARACAQAWLRELPSDPRAADRLGEIAFLARDDETAARWFARAIRLTRSSVAAPSTQEALGLLKRGTALRRAGRRDEALMSLEQADEVAARIEVAPKASNEDASYEPRWLASVISYHARVQSGDALLQSRRYADAVESYEAAREREPEINAGGSQHPILARPEALHNNQAIAEAKLGHDGAAVAAARKARSADPESPVFLETEGFALRRAGRVDEAASAYRSAVRADPTAYTAWNDLGVVLARNDRLAEAATAFRHAVGAEAGYALGWFNLAVALERRGPIHWLAAQGAFGRAFKADKGLRDRERRFISDDSVYFTELDLSKPLPPRWSFAASHQRAPIAAAGFALMVLLGLQLGRSLLTTRFGGDLAAKLVEPVTDVLGRLPRVPVYVPWLLSVLATLAIFAFGLLRSGAGSAGEPLIFILGVCALITIVIRGRLQAARRTEQKLTQRGWTPGIALGAGAAAAGTAWAPLPIAETSDPTAHWIGPLLTAVAALALLILAASLSIPSTLELASVALVMTASMLTPTKPLDGGFIATGTAGVATGLTLVAASLFLVLGLA